MNKTAIIIISVVLGVIILAGAGFAGWYYFIKKVPEGQACKANNRCTEGTSCISGVCSSGKLGSTCSVKEDCKTDFCSSGRCTNGEVGSSCATYKDCKDGLLCKSKICAVKPSYTKYFDKIEIGQMKPGTPPGPDNIPVPTTEFKAGMSIEVDITDTKGTTGEFWVEVINQETGERAFVTEKQTISNPGKGTGFQFNEVGQFDLNVYFNNELIHSIAITSTR
ncbi:MAG: hypothetical protein WC080_01450 [Patescibacteria group bacterium]|jgi:hypothetical protein